MIKITYTVKKQRNGDYTIVQHNLTREFSLKDQIMAFAEVSKKLKEMKAQQSLWLAGIAACKKDPMIKKVVAFYEKLSPQEQSDLGEYLDFKKKTHDQGLAMKRIQSDARKMEMLLKQVQPLLPKVKEEKKK